MIFAFCLAFFVTGCDNSWYDEDVTLEQTTATQPAKPVDVTMPNGKTITVAMDQQTPKSTEYDGEGVTYVRTVDASRFLDITGVSPGEVASRVEAAKITTGAAPAINITPDGIDAKETKQVTTFVGTSGQWGIFSTIWQRIKDFFKGSILWIAIGVGFLFILPIFIPALAPIAGTIIGFLKTAFTWIINMFVPIIAWIKNLFLKKATVQLIQSQEAFKMAVTTSPNNTFTKDEVLAILKSSNNSEQDSKVKDHVTLMKAEIKIP